MSPVTENVVTLLTSRLLLAPTKAVKPASVATSSRYPVAPVEAFQFALNEVPVIALAAVATGAAGSVAVEIVLELALPMKLVDVELLLGGEQRHPLFGRVRARGHQLRAVHANRELLAAPYECQLTAAGDGRAIEGLPGDHAPSLPCPPTAPGSQCPNVGVRLAA